MTAIRMASASLNQTPMDWKGNRENILSAIKEAVRNDVDILCLPELCICGYGCEDMFTSDYVINSSKKSLSKLVNELHDIRGYDGDLVVSVGLPIVYRGSVYNCSCILDGYKKRALVPKFNLCSDGIHYEPRWFSEWNSELGSINIESFGFNETIPFGDLILEFPVDSGDESLRLAVEICEDGWVSSRKSGTLSGSDVDVIMNPSASHFEFGKNKDRLRVITEGSRSLSCSYLYANQLGNEAGRAIYDGSTVIASDGRIIANGRRFSFEDFVFTFTDVDIQTNRRKRRMRSGFDSCTKGPDVVKGDKVCNKREVCHDEGEHVVSGESRYSEFKDAVTLGLYDYLKKSKSSGFTVSLSGGADSSAVCYLVALMVEGALSELGKDRVLEELYWMDDFSVESVLTSVYQSTRNSSADSLESAKSVADECGANFINIDVDGIVEEYKSLINESMDLPVDWGDNWEKFDIPLQNIQARVRSPSVWLIANITDTVLLVTSNRSEASVGYATMDGDTSGGFAPLSGVSKDFLLDWLLFYAELDFPVSVPRVMSGNPTAELRPEGIGQNDEEDLMPYSVLDRIEGLAIEEGKPPIEVCKILVDNLESFEDSVIARWVIKFYRLWSSNQWKRERYAAGLHLDSRDLDPNSWCRFPILSSGFKEEINEIKEEYNLTGGVNV